MNAMMTTGAVRKRVPITKADKNVPVMRATSWTITDRTASILTNAMMTMADATHSVLISMVIMDVPVLMATL